MMHPLPAWVREIRPHQSLAVDQITEAFESGVDVVFLDAPTGSGKTLVAELVRRQLQASALYICSDKSLQQQFLTDFPYANVLQGRSNYPTETSGDELNKWGRYEISAEDCTASTPRDPCWHCPSGRSGCPYHIAKQAAIHSELAVLNTAYFLAETSVGAASAFGGKAARELVIVDEADTLEDMLMNYVQFELPTWLVRKLGLRIPKKGVHKPTLISALRGYKTEITAAAGRGVWRDSVKDNARVQWIAWNCGRVADELEKDLLADDADEDSGRWIRDYDTKTLALKPVIVGPYGTKSLWRHGRKWLLMSGTIISADEMADSLGLPLDYTTVTVPMTFPVENRPIVVAPIADVTRRATEEDYADLVYAVEQISLRHAGERVLVHCVSRMLAEKLATQCVLPGRNVCSYGSAQGKAAALEAYMSEVNSIMFAQSMDRGVDLPGDACRVVVIAKVPFPSLGDRRVSARLRLPGGESWYAVQTVRKIIQMTGRGVRSDVDHATSYVLDKQFAINTFRKSKGLYPTYWRDAIDVGQDVRWLMRSYAGRLKASVA